MFSLRTSKHTCPRRNELGAYGWDKQNEDVWRKDHTCSYCGSLSPEEFFKRVEAGEEVGPTDKTYKAYIGPGHGKFYFQHLSTEDKARFITLYNDRTMKLGYPNYFYTPPFFVRPL